MKKSRIQKKGNWKNKAKQNSQKRINFVGISVLELESLIQEFVNKFDVEVNGDFLIDETPVKLKPDYRKFERFNNDRFKRSKRI